MAKGVEKLDGVNFEHGMSRSAVYGTLKVAKNMLGENVRNVDLVIGLGGTELEYLGSLMTRLH